MWVNPSTAIVLIRMALYMCLRRTMWLIAPAHEINRFGTPIHNLRGTFFAAPFAITQRPRQFLVASDTAFKLKMEL